SRWRSSLNTWMALSVLNRSFLRALAPSAQIRLAEAAGCVREGCRLLGRSRNAKRTSGATCSRTRARPARSFRIGLRVNVRGRFGRGLGRLGGGLGGGGVRHGGFEGAGELGEGREAEGLAVLDGLAGRLALGGLALGLGPLPGRPLDLLDEVLGQGVERADLRDRDGVDLAAGGADLEDGALDVGREHALGLRAPDRASE